MKPTQVLARLFPALVQSAARILLFSITLIPANLLRAAALPPQTYHLPLAFEQNRGQAPSAVKWLGQSSGYRLLFNDDGVTFLLPDKNDTRANAGRRPIPVDRSFQMKYNVMHMKLAGGRPWKNISGVEPTGGVSNYLSPADSKSWISNVPQYQRVKVSDVYQGIDLVFYTNGDNLEYDFVLAPGADPKQIQVAFEGMRGMRVDEKSGDLVLTAPDGSQLRQLRPNVYQQIADTRVEVPGSYRMLGQGRAAFTLAPYDRSRAVVIDPTVDFTTFYGGNSADEPYAIAVDNDGNSYITGGTWSRNFPVTNTSSFENCKVFDFAGFCATGPNIFVAKLDPTGKVLYASYGGVGSGLAIALDSTGVYVTGITFPPDIDNIIGYSDNNNGDYLVWRLESTGGLQDYFQIFGTEATDYGTAIGLDSMHNVWVAGPSYSGDSDARSSGDVDILKLAPDGKFLHEYRFGSNGEDVPLALAIGPSTADRAWITGKTCGNGFPTTDGITHQMSHCGVFVLVLENTGVEDMGMVLGGVDGDDEGISIASNGSEDAYITGVANSTSFPATQGSFQTVKNPGPQAFVAQVDAASPAGLLVRSTFFGADGITTPSSITNNDGKGVYLTGSTTSGHLPGGPVLTPNPTAGFVTKFDVDLTQVRYTQLLGLVVSGAALHGTTSGAPQIYTTGYRYTGGHDFDHEDAFVVKLEESTPASAITNLPQQENGPSFPVSWSGTDSSADIASYDVYVSDNGGSFASFQTGTAATSATFNGTVGHSYGFFSLATDTAGNTEPMKTAPDAVVTDGPATASCAGCFFMTNGARATLAFNVTTTGPGGTFTFDNGDSNQPVKFSSTAITKVNVSGDFAVFDGEGTVNGKTGYTFEVSATDGGPAGSGQDTILVQFYGPNSFTYNAPATIAGGDIVVHQ
jgi:Beta-propeller repeat